MPAAKVWTKRLRLEAGLSQNKLAQFAELDRATVAKAELGKVVTELTVYKLASALSRALGRKIAPVDIISNSDGG